MNNKKTNKVIMYIISMLILFIIPISIIFLNTSTLKGGTEYLFKVEAFDPYDMFRGNYLDIRFKEEYIRGDNNDDIKNSEVYVTIEEDSDGFAYFKDVSMKKPSNTSNYYKTKIKYNELIETPTRYYMNENKSLRAEEIYRENTENAYVKVRVKNGNMVIVGVYVNDELIDSIE